VYGGYWIILGANMSFPTHSLLTWQNDFAQPGKKCIHAHPALAHLHQMQKTVMLPL